MVEKNPYPLDVLEFSLEDRKQFINDHDEEMKYICSSLSHYYEDLKHAVELEFTHSVASHLTYNLVLTLAKGLTSLTIYEYVYGAYLLDDDYNSVYEIWESVYNSANEIIPLLAKLEEENYFDEDIDVEDFLSDIVPPYCLKVKGSEKLLNLHRKVSLKTGHSLIYCLNYYLQTMVNWLNDLKRGVYKYIEGDYDRVYLANYELYKKYYWPNEGRNFRAHIEKYIPSYEKLSSEYLARLLNVERSNFEHTDTGMLWRDYFEDKKDLYFEAKRLNLKEKQWKYFFNSICRFEEYERWINELQSPPSNSSGFKKYVLKPEKADIIVERIKELVNAKDSPKSIMKPIRAAIDAGALERPNWDSFKSEFGEQKLKSKTSFTDYTDPMKQPYDDEGYEILKNEFKRLIDE